MKIIHLCLSNFYIENFGYQENLIPKYNQADGHDVTIIASRFSFDKSNGNRKLAPLGSYLNADGIKVIRINYKYKWLRRLNDKIKIYEKTYSLLEKEKPDLIFVHGIQFFDLKSIIKYKKKYPHCRIIADSHAAYINSGTNLLSKYILHGFFYKNIIQKSIPYIDKFYMIAPGCKTFAQELYKIPSEKMEYLFLGADTLNINFKNQEKLRLKLRQDLNIDQKDFVFITGGKLSKEKNIKRLILALDLVKEKNIKLIIFGPLSEDTRKETLNLIKQNGRISYINWIESNDVYNYYLASDCAIFPGSKSALWEQAICSGLPLICKRWPGMDYVDVGGNCIFLEEGNVEEIFTQIMHIYTNESVYNKMKNVAMEEGYRTFSYENISRQIFELPKHME